MKVRVMVTDEILKLRQQAIELYRIGREEEEALELFERAAESGDYLSDVYIARYLLSKCRINDGVECLNKVIDAYLSESEPDALLIEAAAEALYILGEIDSLTSPQLSESSWEKAAQLGCVKAYYRLGYLYYQSKLHSLERALESWKAGAEAGDSICVEAYNEHLNEDIEEPIYEGETDENGLPHGQGVMYYPKSRLKLWCKLKVAPKCYEGQWCHGVKSGNGQMLYYAENKWDYICYKGSWSGDMPEGTGRLRTCYRDVSARSLVDTYCYEGDWVAGTREGFGVEYLKDHSSYAGHWKGDKKHGKGLQQSSDGQSFRGMWENDVLDRSSCSLESGASLNIRVHHSGFDYNRTAIYLLPCQVGRYKFADGVALMSDKGFNDSEPLIDILSVEDGVVRYCVDGIYSNDNSPIIGTIAEGQSALHSDVVDAIATIYDDDHEYEIVREIEIKWDK